MTRVITNKQRYQTLWDDQNGLCCYCERQMIHKKDVDLSTGRTSTPLMATEEHLKKQAEGGAKTYIGNIRLACYECNSGRGIMDWMTYKSYRMGETLVAF